MKTKLTRPQLIARIMKSCPDLKITGRACMLSLRSVCKEIQLGGDGYAEAARQGILTEEEHSHAMTVFAAQLQNFPYCQKPGCKETTNLTIDHVIPKSRAPLRYADPDNLKTLCHRHNVEKGTRGEIFYK